jgi:integrase
MPLKISLRNDSPFYQLSGSINGRSIRRSLGTDDRSKAEEKAALIEARLWKGELYGDASVARFEDAALAYLKDGADGRFIGKLLTHFRGRLLKDIKPQDIRAAARVLYPDCKPATWNRQAVAPARAIINHAADNGLCPAITIKAFKTEKVARVSVGPEWVKAFRAAAIEKKVPHVASLCWFLFETGCRIGEAVGLSLSDMDYVEGSANLGQTKNGEAYFAYFSTPLGAELAQIPPRHERVFRYLDKSGVYKPWRAICASAGIQYVPPHQAGRHSFATALNALGWTANDIADAGRWKSVSLVQQTYVHASNRGKAAAALIGTEIAQIEDMS